MTFLRVSLVGSCESFLNAQVLGLRACSNFDSCFGTAQFTATVCDGCLSHKVAGVAANERRSQQQGIAMSQLTSLCERVQPLEHLRRKAGVST